MAGVDPFYDERISQYLRERSLLDEDGLERARRERERLKEQGSPKSLAEVLRELRLVPEDELEKAVEHSTTPTEKIAVPAKEGESAAERPGQESAGFAQKLLDELPNLTPEEKKVVFGKLARACGVDFGEDEEAWLKWIKAPRRKRSSARVAPFAASGTPAGPQGAAQVEPAELEPPDDEKEGTDVLKRAAAEAAHDDEEGTDILKRATDEAPTDMLPAARAGEGTPPALPRGYKVLARVGKGAMGTVYKAVQMSLDRVVALKVLSERLSGDRSFIERFQREAKLTASLSHPNIVRAIDVGSSGGKYYYTMEFIEGESVSAILHRVKVLPERRAVEIALQIARALDHARDQGLIHRDVKPGNILIATDGTAKLTDMGLARPIYRESGDRPITKHGMALGTADYVSPEQARGEELDTRTDVYALGATLFRMVAGHPPFRGRRRSDVVHKHLTEPPPRADELNPDVGEGTTLVVLKAMEKDREKRYGTPAEMASDLEAILRGEAPAIPARDYRARTTVRTARAVRPRASNLSTWALLVGVAAAVVVTIAGYMAARGGPETPAESGRAESRYEGLLRRARQKIDDEDYDAAIGLLENAARVKDGEEVQGLLRSARRGRYVALAVAAEGEGDLASAIDHYGKALDIRDEQRLRERVSELQRRLEFTAALEQGDGLFEGGDWNVALEAYAKALELARGPEVEKVEKSVRATEKEIRYAAAMAQGAQALAARKWNEAVAHGEAALALKAGDKAAKDLIAHSRSGEEEEREERAYAEAMAAGQGALEARAWQEAVARGEAALAVRPGDEAAVKLIAAAGRGAEEERKAAAYARAMAKGREALDARAWEGAVKHGASALEIRPDDPEALRLIASATEAQEKARKAAYEEATAGAGKAARAGEWEKVAELARSALTIWPEGPEARGLLRQTGAELKLERQIANSIGMDFVLVPAGEFLMGSEDGQSDERPARRVYLDSFYVSKYEVTNSQFERFRPGHSHEWRGFSPRPDMPVISVTWEDAVAFCEWLAEKEGAQYRLPTEAEWEKAARGAGGRVFPWGNEPPDADGVYRCNFAAGDGRDDWAKDRFELVAPAGSFPSHRSPYGALDMAGNVWEWCLDWYAAGYSNAGTRNPLGPQAGEKRVLRGGSFTKGPDSLRCANRAAHFPQFCNVNVGFRCVRLPGSKTTTGEASL